MQLRARALPPAWAIAAVVLAAGGCGRAVTGFDEARARSHIDALAGTIGSRPVGSDAAARARVYIVDQLERAGFTVRIQQAESTDERRGLTVPVANIIAVSKGGDEGAIALTSHYDSAPDAAGALDDALGVAVCLEAGRVLAASGLRHALAVIVTDGEEVGLMGARVAVRDEEIARRVRAFLNFDGTGAAGPSLLFEAAAGRAGQSALAAWAAGAPAADGGSYATEIYRHLPNDTDFTIFRTLGQPGLNFAQVGDSYAYHTDRDTAARVRPEPLRHALRNTIGTVQQIDRTGLAVTAEPSTFFDIAGRGVTYGAWTSTAIAWAAALLGTLVWILQTRALWQIRGAAGLVLTPAWAVVTTAVSAGAMIGVAWTLRAARAELHPWYASPHWFFASTLGCGLLAWTAMSAIARHAPQRLTPARDPIATWWLALPLWIALTLVLHMAAPSASYLAAMPLLTAAAVLLAAGRRPVRIRIASVLVLAVAAHFWVPETGRLLFFSVALFGWMPVVPPAATFAALMAIALVFCGPPVAALLAGRRGSVAGAGVLAAGVAIAAVLTWTAPAYTSDRPQRRTLRYVLDEVRQRAWWEQAGPERRAELAANAPSAGRWDPVAGAPDTTVPVAPVGGVFRFRTSAVPVAPAPAEVRVTSGRVREGIAMTIAIEPRQYLSSTLVLAPGVVPRSSSIAGVVAAGRWRATYAAVPAAGLEVRVVLDERDAATIGEVVVLLGTFAVPDTAPGQRVPAWVPSGEIAWQPRGLYVIRPASGAPLRLLPPPR